MSSFYLSAAERRGLLVLVLIVVAIVLIIVLLPKDKMGGFIDRTNYQSKGGNTYMQAPRSVETFYFDPNTADSTELLRLGFSPRSVRAIYKYRSLGGVYSSPEDITHIPNVTNGLYERLRPYVRIAHAYQRVTPQYAPRQRIKDDTIFAQPLPSDTFPHTPKLAPGKKIALNTSDTTTLRLIPGIGPYYARKIVDYRNRLGGFVSLAQLDDIDELPYGIENYVVLDSVVNIRKIDINHCSKRTLISHPYIGLDQAIAIWDYRHLSGMLRSPDDLRRLAPFSENDVQRLVPYLLFK